MPNGRIRRKKQTHDASRFPCGFCGEFIWPGEDHKDGLCMLGKAQATVQLAYDTMSWTQLTQEQQESLERSILPNHLAALGGQVVPLD